MIFSFLFLLNAFVLLQIVDKDNFHDVDNNDADRLLDETSDESRESLELLIGLAESEDKSRRNTSVQDWLYDESNESTQSSSERNTMASEKDGDHLFCLCKFASANNTVMIIIFICHKLILFNKAGSDRFC